MRACASWATTCSRRRRPSSCSSWTSTPTARWDAGPARPRGLPVVVQPHGMPQLTTATDGGRGLLGCLLVGCLVHRACRLLCVPAMPLKSAALPLPLPAHTHLATHAHTHTHTPAGACPRVCGQPDGLGGAAGEQQVRRAGPRRGEANPDRPGPAKGAVLLAIRWAGCKRLGGPAHTRPAPPTRYPQRCQQKSLNGRLPLSPTKEV